MLPDARCAAIGPANGGYFLGWSKEYRPEPAAGVVEHFSTPARVEALERKDEWLRQRMNFMKRAGMSNQEIIYAWYTKCWTRYGVFEMPEGWKDLEL